MRRKLWIPIFLSCFLMLWAASDAQAYVYGVTNLEYNSSLSGYSYTTRDYGDDFYVTDDCNYGPTCYIQYYAAWVSAGATLYNPWSALVTSAYDEDQYYAWASVGAEVAEQYGVWTQQGEHVLYADVYETFCEYDPGSEAYNCGSSWWYTGTYQMDSHSSDDYVEVAPPTPPGPAELTDISWSTQEVWVTVTEPGCYRPVWNPEAVNTIDFEVEVEGGAAGGTITNWPKDLDACIPSDAPPEWFGTWRIKWARASNGTRPLEFGANGPAITIHPPPPPPQLTGITPSGAVRGSSGTLSITGVYLNNATVESCGARVVLSNVTVSTNTVSADYQLPENAATGPCTLTVYADGGDDSIDFTVADPTPAITSISPSQVEAWSTVNVTIEGTGFGSNPTLQVSPSFPVTLGAKSNTRIEATFDLSQMNDTSIEVKVISQGHGGNNFTPTAGTQQNSDPLPLHVLAGQLAIRLLANGQPLQSFGNATISAVPAMPTLTASITRASGASLPIADTTWYARFWYQGSEIKEGNWVYSPAHIKYVPANGLTFLFSNEAFDITGGLNGAFAGGYVDVQANYKGVEIEFRFQVLGNNPSRATILANPPTTISPLPWFFWKLAKYESKHSLIQFNTIPSVNGFPVYGNPDGWGLMQIDRTSTGQPTEMEVLWNWKANINAGGAVLVTKQAEMGNAWGNIVQTWQGYNANNPDVPEPTRVTGLNGINCTFSSNALGDPINSGERSFYDAIWMKRYNGNTGGGNYVYFKTANLLPTETLGFNYRPTNNDGINYVERVCGEPPPQP